MQQTVTPPNLLILFDFLIYAMGFDGGDEGIRTLETIPRLLP